MACPARPWPALAQQQGVVGETDGHWHFLGREPCPAWGQRGCALPHCALAPCHRESWGSGGQSWPELGWPRKGLSQHGPRGGAHTELSTQTL